MLYQGCRFLVLWVALYLDMQAFGTIHALVVATLFGLTLRYDYWSNAIELLGSVLVCGGFHWAICLVAGVGLGLGRETLPFLAILWTPSALALSGGAVLSQAVVRRFTRRDPKWDQAEREELQYGKSQVRTNLFLLSGAYPPAYLDIAVYVCVAVLGFLSAPLLTVGLVAVTCAVARIDEPRVLTMLLPAAASTVIRWL